MVLRSGQADVVAPAEALWVAERLVGVRGRGRARASLFTRLVVCVRARARVRAIGLALTCLVIQKAKG